jgi:hypothetical protein
MTWSVRDGSGPRGRHTAKDLEQRRHLASDERLYTGGTLTISVDLPLLSHQLRNGTGILDAR